MNRNAKQLQKKSHTHTVEQVSDEIFTVTSGASGNEYHVFLNEDGSALCGCPWGEHRPAGDKRTVCSHVLSVMSYLAGMDGRKVSAWASEEEARRQRRPIIANNIDGITLTSRIAR